jgi:hypothetical protein
MPINRLRVLGVGKSLGAIPAGEFAVDRRRVLRLLGDL